jgi:hypothetical protein
MQWEKNVNLFILSSNLCFTCPYALTEHHAMKAYWGSEDIAPHCFDLGTRWMWVVTFTRRPVYPQGMIAWYPLDRRLGGPQNRSGHGGEEKNFEPLPRLELPDHPARSPALYHWAIPAPMLSLYVEVLTYLPYR